ncbi:hypothetical protein HN954_03815 [bacterium]|jgi:hypothetical protein|nr:hypothetical protein [bacterium]MBT6831872.1 hypothetical protein [bacterium]MBT6996526.1 hypothetical protein [bacterium]MBT7773019.1 hypothetical protein [bacterium]
MKNFSKILLGVFALSIFVSTAAAADLPILKDIPYNTTLEAFKAALTPAPQAKFEVFKTDGSTIATDLKSGYLLTVTAGDGVTARTYKIEIAPNVDATITSKIGSLNVETGTLSNVPYNVPIADLKAAITPATQATFDIFKPNGSTVADRIAEGYKVIVTAGDGKTKKEFVINLAPNTATTFSSLLGDIDLEKATVNNLEFGMRTKVFASGLKMAPEAAYQIFQEDGATLADENASMKTGYKMTVTAGDGVTVKTYVLNLLPNTNASVSFSLDKLLEMLKGVASPSEEPKKDELKME